MCADSILDNGLAHLDGLTRPVLSNDTTEKVTGTGEEESQTLVVRCIE